MMVDPLVLTCFAEDDDTDYNFNVDNVDTGDCNEGNVPDAGFANRIESCCRVDSRKEALSDGARNLLQQAQSRF